jgi:2-polyprenyl-3-methyl-5-hydroxy-6-metoxy-1,4-benzoquinol methylase
MTGVDAPPSEDLRPGLLTRFLHRQRVGAALPYLRGNVLDHGCGPYSLAAYVAPEKYLGMDIDERCLVLAGERHPAHRFVTEVPNGARYDTVASLAVIEHMPDPTAYLRLLASFLGRGGRIVLTTPHPRRRRVYELGAKLRLFSPRASEEHGRLLDRREIGECAEAAGLRLSHYRTFLAGANQLAVLEATAANASGRGGLSGAD